MKLISQSVRPTQMIRTFSKKSKLHLFKTLTTTSNNRIFSNRISSVVASERTFRKESISSFQPNPLLKYRQFSDDTPNNDEKDGIDLSKFTKEVDIKLPELVDDHKAKIVKWHKQEGDIIKPNDTICDIETELFTFEYQVEDECLGVMKEIVLVEGEETSKADSTICIILHVEDHKHEEEPSGKDESVSDKKEN